MPKTNNSTSNNNGKNASAAVNTTAATVKKRVRKPKEEVVYLVDKKEEEVIYEPSFLYKLFVILFGFNYLLPISSPLWGLTFILFRGYAMYNFNIDEVYRSINGFFGQSNITSEMGVLYTIFVFLPLTLYLLAFSIWTIWVSITVFYFNTGFFERNSNYSGNYDQIEKLKEYRDNKMKFMSYKDAADLMRKTAVINNLDEKNPQARRTLDYINNKIRFMSYKDAVEFLNGSKK
jgi:hypothetical protein